MKKALNKKILIVIFIIVVILIFITSFFVFKSRALYKTNDQHNFMNSKVNMFLSKDFAYTGNSQEFIVPQSGYYEIGLWGASGVDLNYIGKGGYTKGTIYLTKGEKLYFYVGNIGLAGCNVYSDCPIPAWNGGSLGGYAPNFPSYKRSSNGGGGATDVRLVSGVWNNSASLRSRIMVSGGGGGGSANDTSPSGNGGDLIGGNGKANSLSTAIGGKGGNQSYGGIQSGDTKYNGKFGRGGDGYVLISGNISCSTSQGGGGGYYGGAGGKGGAGDCVVLDSYGVAGGGSSYISGYAGVNSVLETGGTAEVPLHTNNTIHYSNKYFINGKMQVGINSGSGKAKITYIGKTIPSKTNSKLNNVRYIKDCLNGSNLSASNIWTEIQAIKDGKNLALGKVPIGTVAQNPSGVYTNATDGKMDNELQTAATSAVSSATGLQCLTIDLGQEYDLDEIVTWHFFLNENRKFNTTLSVGALNASTTTSLSTILHNYTTSNGYVETSNGKRYSAWD